MRQSHTEVGTPEYDERMEQQAQSAMAAAIAHPVGRVFAGVLFVVALGLMPEVVADLIWGDKALWIRISRSIVMGYGFVLVLIETGSIVVTGGSRFLWYRDMTNRWRARQ